MEFYRRNLAVTVTKVNHSSKQLFARRTLPLKNHCGSDCFSWFAVVFLKGCDSLWIILVTSHFWHAWSSWAIVSCKRYPVRLKQPGRGMLSFRETSELEQGSWYAKILYPEKQLCVTIIKSAFVQLLEVQFDSWEAGPSCCHPAFKFHLGVTSFFDRLTQHRTAWQSFVVIANQKHLDWLSCYKN